MALAFLPPSRYSYLYHLHRGAHRSSTSVCTLVIACSIFAIKVVSDWKTSITALKRTHEHNRKHHAEQCHNRAMNLGGQPHLAMIFQRSQRLCRKVWRPANAMYIPIWDRTVHPLSIEGRWGGGARKMCLSQPPQLAMIPFSGQNQKSEEKKTKSTSIPLKVGTWNVRTLMDSAGSDRPQRRGALETFQILEKARYN